MKTTEYKGYRLINNGYYPSDHCIWWEAEHLKTGETDFRAHTMRDLKAQIDEDEKESGCEDMSRKRSD